MPTPYTLPPEPEAPENGGAIPLHVADRLFIAFSVLLAILWVGPALSWHAAWSYVLRNIGVIALYVVLTRIRMPSLAAAVWLRAALVWVVVPFDYFQTGALIDAWQPSYVPQIQAFLAASDRWLLGAGFHDWLRGIRHPVVTEVLQLCYAAFFFLPALLILILSARKKLSTIPEAYLAVVFAFLVSYLGYLLVPARSPAFLDESLVPDGGVLFAGQLWLYLRELGGGAHDAFPSGHTAVSLLVIHYAWKTDRVAALVLVPVAGALILSTVYMQYHYLLDVIAGALLALLAALFARFVVARTEASAGGGEKGQGASAP